MGDWRGEGDTDGDRGGCGRIIGGGGGDSPAPGEGPLMRFRLAAVGPPPPPPPPKNDEEDSLASSWLEDACNKEKRNLSKTVRLT